MESFRAFGSVPFGAVGEDAERVAVRGARSYFGTVSRGNVRENGLRTFHESNRANGETVKSEEEKQRLEARGGIEPPIMVLQTIALPLGYRAAERNEIWTADARRQ